MTTVVQVGAFQERSRVNGPGLRSVVWVQGCPNRCPGCFNPEFLPFIGGQTVTVADLARRLLAVPDTEGVTFSGGEPFAQAAALAAVAALVRAAGKSVAIFTGYPRAALLAARDPGVRQLLAAPDLLVAGPYERERPARGQPLLASANQEIVLLTTRYRAAELASPGGKRTEFRIKPDGAVEVSGFPGADLRRP